MSNSPLVSYTKLSPNHSGKRKHAIDTISIHCMAGNLSVERCGELFQNKERQASSNYGIGSDGRIGLYVDEANRSWCTSSASNDNRAITIEVANTVAKDPWPVSDAAYKSLIDLLVDICQRNGIPRLLWKGDKNLVGQVDRQNMTVHRWFANKACPGDYLYNLHGQIAKQVNERLGAAPAEPEKKPDPKPSGSTFAPYLVRITASVLNIRKGPGTSYAVTGQIKDRGVYTIVGQKGNWGRLKSGAGWISLSYTKKV